MCANRQQEGDPEGRRLARRRALLLAEAGKVARLLEILLRRAGYNTDSYEELVKDLAGHENSQLVKSYGKLESRKRYKGQSSQPLLDERNINALYVDENGKSKPEPQTGPTFFTLGAISMMPDDAVIYRESADKLKGEFFGRTDVTFHEPYMSNHDGLYYFNGDQDKQSEFDDAIRKLIQATPFVGFGVGVRKDAYAEFMVEESDPYLPTDVYSLAIDLLLERYVDYLATRGERVMGRVTFESQGPKEDAEHQMEYARLLLEGTQWVPASAFRNWLETGMRFTPKSDSDPMELADMFSRSLYEWVRDGCHVAPSKWDVFETKMYCREDGLRGKFGIKIFPDTDIRDRIEEHRHHVAQRRETKSAHLRESERR